jgi:hypothetical protein
MGNPIRKMAEIHKRSFERLLEATGVEIAVRQPAPRNVSINAKDKVFGGKTLESDIGEIQLVTVIWSNDVFRPEAVVAGDVAEAVSGLAHNTGGKPVDAVIRMKLSEALLQADAPQGMTIFDTAKDILYQGQRFQILSTKRTGLPPIGPYTIWVGLTRIGGGK